MDFLDYFSLVGEEEVLQLQILIWHQRILLWANLSIGEVDIELAPQGSSSHAMSTSISIPQKRNKFELIDWIRFDHPEDLTRDELRAWQD